MKRLGALASWQAFSGPAASSFGESESSYKARELITHPQKTLVSVVFKRVNTRISVSTSPYAVSWPTHKNSNMN